MMRLIVRTSLRNALEKIPAPVMAHLVDVGYVAEWPLELTRYGARNIELAFGANARRPSRYRPRPEITGSFRR